MVQELQLGSWISKVCVSTAPFGYNYHFNYLRSAWIPNKPNRRHRFAAEAFSLFRYRHGNVLSIDGAVRNERDSARRGIVTRSFVRHIAQCVVLCVDLRGILRPPD